MPYTKWEDINPSLKGIKPKISLAQANAIAKQADAIGGDKGWPVAISNFKKTHTKQGDKWVAKAKSSENESGDDEMSWVEETVGTDSGAFEECSTIYIPSSVMSFDEFDQNIKARKMREVVETLTEVFVEIIRNISWASEGDKPAMYQKAFSEFVDRVKKIQSESMSSEESQLGGGESEGAESVTISESLESHAIEFVVIDPDHPEIVSIVENEEGAKSTLAYVDVELIQPGWGNTKQNHYYTKEVLRKFADRFIGAKMFESDHRQEQKSTENWVSTIVEIKGFSDVGAPIAKVAIHKPGFVEGLKNLKEAGILNKMECSILANGTVRPGVFSEGGRKGKLVESFTTVDSVDWVTHAGAGGHVVNFSESANPPEPDSTSKKELNMPEPDPKLEEKFLETEEVKKLLAESQLPPASRERLEKVKYLDEKGVQEAILFEVDYLKRLSESGLPFGVTGKKAPSKPEVTTTFEEDMKSVLEKYL